MLTRNISRWTRSCRQNARQFHRSRPSLRGDSPPPNPQSPIRIFIDTFKSELKKSQELQESVKALQGESQKFGESDAYKKAREAYEKSKEGYGTAAGVTGKIVRKTGAAIGSGAAAAWESAPVRASRTAANFTADVVDRSTKPIRESEIYKNVSSTIGETIDDGSSSRYGGFAEKEARKKAREQQEALAATRPKLRKTDENPDAGGNVVLHKDSAWKESWQKYKEGSSVMQGLNRFKANYSESENPIVSSTREVTDKISEIWGSWTAENESARVYRLMKEIDPNFRLEPWLQELRDYILPEIVDAYVKGDQETLKLWLGEAPFATWQATAKEYIAQGLMSDGKVVDIRGVDVQTSRVVPPNDIPVFIISFRTQEIHMYRDAKSGEIVAGREDHVQQVTYAAVFTRLPDELTDPETHGWRCVDFARGAARDII